MTPEERKGVETLLAKMDGTEPTYAWLQRQLAHAKWDDDIEKMGGGKKARDAYMNPVFDAPCSVTAFDMHAQLTTDGRERGLWVWLLDESKGRAERYDAWAANALEEFCKLAGIDQKGAERFRMSMAMDSFKLLANDKVNEAALLEWPAVEKLHKVIGAQLAKRTDKPNGVKVRKPKKPDRRAENRRRDDKRKARLR